MRSMLIFTVHKAASMFLHKISSEISKELGMEYFSINHDDQSSEIKRMSWKQYIQEGTKQGIFGPIRAGAAEPSIPDNLSDYAVVLHLRDPRDVLTSLYFSYTFSHRRVEGKFCPSDEQRRQWSDAGIDAYALTMLPDLKGRYELLLAELLGRDNVTLLKYEDLVTNYSFWLKGFLSAFSYVNPPARRVLKLIPLLNNFEDIYGRLYKRHENDFEVASEDIFRHRRQITPGDHKRKLRAETVAALNDQLALILEQLDYDR